jgi:hypothetical protein
MVTSKAIAGAVVVMSLLFISGCASARGSVKETVPLVDSVSVALDSTKEIRIKFGADSSKNPFILKGGSITGSSNDFVEAHLSLVTNEGATVELLEAKVVDKENKTKAWLFEYPAFSKFVAQVGNPDDSSGALKRQNLVDWNYLPSQSFLLKRGKYEYMMVFYGKHPIPDDLQLYVRLTVNDKEQEFNLPVPDQE